MNKYLISLDKDNRRRELFFSQKNTADFRVFSAINTMQVEWDELAEQFDLVQFERHYGRKVTKGEIGCTLSHLNVYRLIVEDDAVLEDDYALVCEDDALFAANFQQNLTALLASDCSASPKLPIFMRANWKLIIRSPFLSCAGRRAKSVMRIRTKVILPAR